MAAVSAEVPPDAIPGDERVFSGLPPGCAPLEARLALAARVLLASVGGTANFAPGTLIFLFPPGEWTEKGFLADFGEPDSQQLAGVCWGPWAILGLAGGNSRPLLGGCAWIKINPGAG